MGQVMTLRVVVEGLPSMDGEATIYAAEPWTEDSEALVAQEPGSGRPPLEAESLGLKYFLEVAIARDFVEGWAASLDHDPPIAERCRRLIQYALTDA